MSMRIVFLQDHEQWKADKEYYVETTLARRLCIRNIATPYVTYQKEKEAAEIEKARAENEKKILEAIKAKKEKEAAEKEAEEKKAEKEAKKETATSKTAESRKKATK